MLKVLGEKQDMAKTFMWDVRVLRIVAILWIFGCIAGVAHAEEKDDYQTVTIQVALRYGYFDACTCAPARVHYPLRLTANPTQPDPWLAFDKVQHVTFGFLATVGSQYTLVNKADWSERRALPVSMAASALLGISKELYDWRWSRSRFFSTRDLVADALGIALAAGFIAL